MVAVLKNGKLIERQPVEKLTAASPRPQRPAPEKPVTRAEFDALKAVVEKLNRVGKPA